MALFFKTDNPKGLLKAFNERIDQKDKEGKITTWERDSEGDYTHKSEQWGGKAWFRPLLIEAADGVEPTLRFNIVAAKYSDRASDL